MNHERSDTDEGPNGNGEIKLKKDIKMNDHLLTISKTQRQIYYIFTEYATIAKNPIEGVYIVVSSSSPFVWFGVIIVRTGIFCGGIFRFKITFDENFPDTEFVPEVEFEDNIFHPLINTKNKRVNLTRNFPSGWQKDRNHIYQVLIAIQAMFFSCQIDPNQAENPEAAILLKENKKKFIELSHDIVRRSRTQVYATPDCDDRNAIKFSPWNEEEMEPFRRYLITNGEIPDISTSALMESSLSSSHTSSTYPQSASSLMTLLFRKQLASKPKSGFSWVNAETSRYMCDIFPEKNIHEKQNEEETSITDELSKGMDE